MSVGAASAPISTRSGSPLGTRPRLVAGVCGDSPLETVDFPGFLAPKGPKHVSPAATPWVPGQRSPASPERAKQGENPGLATILLRPFRAETADAIRTQGDASRLTPLRCALGLSCYAPSGQKTKQAPAFSTIPIPHLNPNFASTEAPPPAGGRAGFGMLDDDGGPNPHADRLVPAVAGK